MIVYFRDFTVEKPAKCQKTAAGNIKTTASFICWSIPQKTHKLITRLHICLHGKQQTLKVYFQLVAADESSFILTSQQSKSLSPAPRPAHCFCCDLPLCSRFPCLTFQSTSCFILKVFVFYFPFLFFFLLLSYNQDKIFREICLYFVFQIRCIKLIWAIWKYVNQ